MIALYFSWLSILFGAQVAYAFQNRRSYVQDRLMENLNNQGREILALRIMTEAAHKFYRGDGPMSALTIAENLKVPSRLVISVVQALQSNRLLYELNLEEPAYLPARPLRNITFQDVIQAIRVGQSDEIGTGTEAGSSHVERQYHKVIEAEKTVANEVNLNDLVELLVEQEASAPPSSETVAELADSHLASQYGSV